MRSNGKTVANSGARQQDRKKTSIESPASLASIALDALTRGEADLTRLRDTIRESFDKEAIHDMRVSIRQMRAAIRVGGALLPKGIAQSDAELSWIFDSLGAVRDADIAIEKVGERHDDCSEMAPIRDALARLREEAREALESDLGSPRYQSFQMALAALIDQPAEHSADAASAIAPDLIAQEFRRVKKAGKKLGKSSSESAIHRVRRRAKRFRYTLDLFKGAYGRPADRMITELRAFQDLLGNHQDCLLAERRMNELVESGNLPPEASELAIKIAKSCSKKARTIRADFRDAFASLTRKPWKDLRRRMESSRLAFVRSLRIP